MTFSFNFIVLSSHFCSDFIGASKLHWVMTAYFLLQFDDFSFQIDILSFEGCNSGLETGSYPSAGRFVTVSDTFAGSPTVGGV
jgi:hypothetical protein